MNAGPEALRARIAGESIEFDVALGYQDVVDAWNYYLEHDNHNRGVVLIGHSQGSGVLARLIANEIEGQPIQANIISALLTGSRVAVPAGAVVGGQFEEMPLCESAIQTGCIITFASFRETIPPPADSRFGRVEGEGMVAACTNPAALEGGSGELHAYMSAGRSGVSTSSNAPLPWTADGQPITTPFVSLPGLLSAECSANEFGTYLSVTVHGDPADSRTDDIAGDVVFNGEVQANWGLHLIDVNLTMGNLLAIVETQFTAWSAGR